MVDQTTDMSSKPQTDQTGTDVTGNMIVYSRYNPTPDEGDDNIAYLLTMFRVDGLYPL